MDTTNKKKRFIPPVIKFLLIMFMIVFCMAFFFKTIVSYMLGDLTNLESPIEKFSSQDKKDQSQLEDLRLIAESSDDPYLGNKDAKLVIVEFMDFGCPYCREEFSVLEQLVRKFPNEIKIIFRDFPIDGLHAQATNASKAANCAHHQGQYFNMSKFLYENQDNFSDDQFLTYASELQLDVDTFTQCYKSPIVEKEIQADQMDGLAIGVAQTPVFYINGQRMAGAIPYETFERIIQVILNK